MSYARRTDATHAEFRSLLRECGWYVLDTHAVPGFFDVIACKRGDVWFCEFKDGAKKPSARALTSAQLPLHRDMRAAGAQVAVLDTAESVVALGMRKA
jgi:hypothetical protein